jgi:Domain of unknown function (DUF4351)
MLRISWRSLLPGLTSSMAATSVAVVVAKTCTSMSSGKTVGRTQLEERFGQLPAAVVERLQQLPAPQVIALAKALIRAQSLAPLGLEN